MSEWLPGQMAGEGAERVGIPAAGRATDNAGRKIGTSAAVSTHDLQNEE
jgi:hypothetical protein